jgi:hypothetical protein
VRSLEELARALENPLGEANTPGDRVEEKQRRIEASGALGERIASGCGIVTFAVAERSAEIARVAHERERRHRFERLSDAAERRDDERARLAERADEPFG